MFIGLITSNHIKLIQHTKYASLSNQKGMTEP